MIKIEILKPPPCSRGVYPAVSRRELQPITEGSFSVLPRDQFRPQPGYPLTKEFGASDPTEDDAPAEQKLFASAD